MRKRKAIRQARRQTPFTSADSVETEDDWLSSQLDNNTERLRAVFHDCYDIVFRSFTIGQRQEAVLIYVNGLVNIEEVNEHLLAPLMEPLTDHGENREESDTALSELLAKKIPVAPAKAIHTIADGVQEVLSGHPVLLVDGQSTALSFNLRMQEKRAIEEPPAESNIRGPRDAFIETLNVNTALLRQRIKSPRLKMRVIQVGRYTKTNVAVAYVEGVADPTLLEEIDHRLGRIDIDGIVDTSIIEELIEDEPLTPFPLTLVTERPDVVTASLLEGKAAILVDGSPQVLVVPTTLFSLLQSPDDYYSRYWIGTAIRWLRYFLFAASLVLPSLYVAVLTFHQEMIPTNLLVRIAATREQVPFPALIEAMLMEVMFEALREAGVRLPKQIGQAVSIVGALVIGDAAVSAGLVSPAMVLIVAITGIASFTIPRYNITVAIRLLRFPMMILAGIIGLLGVMLGIIFIIVHLATLRSFGVPYMSPLGPTKRRDMKDVLFRVPAWMMDTRPRLTGDDNRRRQAPGQKPDPARGGES
nr:hypothetical protein [Bacillota bacterium]